MKETISDALAWIAFNALLLWLLTLFIGLSGYWDIYQQLAAFVDSIRGCTSDHCSAQMSLNDVSTQPIWFGIDLSFVLAWRSYAFFTWLGIIVFQSFFVGHMRVRPWRSLPTPAPATPNAPSAATPPTSVDDERGDAAP